MCGIVGFWDKDAVLDHLEETVTRMTSTLEHRGPDSSGVWVDQQARVGFGHKRLAILDLSPEGHQPMVSNSGRFVISYNGEVYNFDDLRTKLEAGGVNFRGNSDTEVILAAIECWGLTHAVTKFIGMFAFSLWDREKRKILLVRDRLGIKPIYYGQVNGSFVFASELKAIRTYPRFSGRVNRGALTLQLRHGYIPAPHSIYEGIYKLEPGHILSVDAGTTHHVSIQTQSYWSAKSVAEQGMADPFGGSSEEAIELLDALLRDAVSLRMLSDVPLGAFLSGGIDSSTVVALMQAQSARPVRTFSIGFQDKKYNEADHAKVVAHHLGTEHTELYVTPEDAMTVIPKLPSLYDEPFSDPSQIPTFLVSQLAREHVTVSLSGDGGDELFGGYYRYFWGRNILNSIGKFPQPIRSLMRKGLMVASPGTWDTIFMSIRHWLPKNVRVDLPGDKFHKLANVIDATSADAFYFKLISYWKDPTAVVRGVNQEALTVLTEPAEQVGSFDLVHKMMFYDLMSYLPDDILVKLDRASMGVSLEARVPLLDHRVVEFAWGLPLNLKLRGGQGKWILRKVLNKYIPDSIMERPKMGFSVPIDAWLRGPLREWGEEMLDRTRLRNEGFFDPSPIRKKWEEHLSGRHNWQEQLWAVLMFQMWLEDKK